MGSGTYRATTRTTYAYDKATKSSGTYKAHESLDPLKNKTLSTEHPLSVPIIVGFDSTGSIPFPSSSQTTALMTTSSLKVVAS